MSIFDEVDHPEKSSKEVPEYKQLLHVDRSRMEEMLDTQPMRFMWAVEQSANADTIVREKVQAFDVAKAIAFGNLKSIKDNKGKGLTDTAIKTMLPNQEEYIEAYNALTAAKSDASIMSGVVDSFSQRKTMLAKSVEREIMGIRSDPVGSVNAKKFGEESADSMKESFDRRDNG